jgi:hypothetical protein
MLHRLICAILAALMPFLIAAPVFAQDNEPPFPVICGELPEEDCALIEESTLAMKDLSSYSIAMAADFSMSGIPDMPADPLAFELQVDGSFAMDEAAKAVVQQLNSMMMGMMSGSAGNMLEMNENMQQMLLDLYGGMDFDITLQYTLPPDLAEVLSQDSEVPVPETLAMDIRMIDGIMYMNVAELRALDPAIEEEITSDWIGMDYVGLLEMQMEEGGMGDDPVTAGTAAGVATAQIMSEMIQFVTVERLDDVDLGDQDGAVFSYSFDIIGFLTSDSFRTAMENMVPAMSEDMSAGEVDEMLGMLDFVAPMLFRDLEINTGTVIGVEDKLTHSTTFDFSWDLASLMQVAAMSDPSLAETLGDAEPAISIGFTCDYADFNDEMIFEVPEDVQVIPLEQLVPQDTSTVF